MKQALGVFALALAVAGMGPVHAQSAPAAPWYAGAAIGQARSNVDAGEVDDYVRSLGYGSTSTSAEDKDMAHRLSVGFQYDVTPELGLRAEVETFRKLGDDSTGGELKLDVISLGAVFRF